MQSVEAMQSAFHRTGRKHQPTKASFAADLQRHVPDIPYLLSVDRGMERYAYPPHVYSSMADSGHGTIPVGSCLVILALLAESDRW